MMIRLILISTLALSAGMWSACDGNDMTTPSDTTADTATLDVEVDSTNPDTGGQDGETDATCARECGPQSSCIGGQCTCDAGYDDCDLEPSNGCEVELGTDFDCTACGDNCNIAQNVTGLACTANGCEWTDCISGFADCDGQENNGCEVELANDVDHCGACDAACVFTNSTGECVNNACVITECSPDSYDVDKIASNGCEMRVVENVNEFVVRQVNPVGGDGADQLGLRGGDPFELVYDADDGSPGSSKLMGYEFGKDAAKRRLVDVQSTVSDIHITPPLGASEPLAIMTSIVDLTVVDIDRDPIVETASHRVIGGGFQATQPYRVKSLGLPGSLRSGQMIAISSASNNFNGSGVIFWYQVAQPGEPEFDGSGCTPTSSTGIQLCQVDDLGLNSVAIPAIQDLDIIPLVDETGASWRPLIIAAGAGEVVFAEPDFTGLVLNNVNANIPPKDAGTTASIPNDVLDVVALPGDDDVAPGFALVAARTIVVYRFMQSAPGAKPSGFERASAFNAPASIIAFKDAEAVDSTKIVVSGNGAPNSILLATTPEVSGVEEFITIDDDVSASYGELEYAPETGQLLIFHNREIESWTLEFTP